MNDLNDLLRPGAVTAALAAGNKKTLFQQLAARAAEIHGVDPAHVIERLTERERLGSTGFGGGVAIPHAKIDGLDRPVGVFARLDAAIDFAAIDDMPVDVVFLLLSPADAGADHLKALAGISRLLRDRAFVAKLRGAGSDDALHALLAGGDDARDAA